MGLKTMERFGARDMVAVGGKGDYSLFPGMGGKYPLPWEDNEVR